MIWRLEAYFHANTLPVRNHAFRPLSGDFTHLIYRQVVKFYDISLKRTLTEIVI